jgi:hypothetical protein
LAQEIPTFAEWLLDHVRTQMENGVVVDPDVVVYFHPPPTLALYIQQYVGIWKPLHALLEILLFQTNQVD